VLRLNGQQTEIIKSQYRAFRITAADVALDIEKRRLNHQFETEGEAKRFITWLTQQQFVFFSE